MVSFLIDQGANIKVVDKKGRTPLDVANAYRKSEIANLLTQKQIEYDNKLLTAAERGNVSEVTNLLNGGANIEAKDKNGWTPLYYALRKGHLSTVELLLDRKANIEAKIENGWTPLLYAIRYSSKDIIQLLIRKGANTSATDIKGQTVARGAMLASRSSDILDLVWHSSGAGDSVYYYFHYKPGKSKREVYTPSVDKKISLESIGPRGRRSIGEESENSLQNDEIDYNKGGATSGASKSSSWINIFAHTIVDTVKGVTQFISSPLMAALPSFSENSSNRSGTAGNSSNYSNTVRNLNTQYTMGVCVNNNVSVVFSWLQAKYPFPKFSDVSLEGASACAANITNSFKKALEQQAKLKGGIQMHRLDINFAELDLEITKKIEDGKFNEIPGILRSYAEKALPGREAGCSGKLSPKKFNKFMTEFDKGLDVTLNQSMQQILHSRNSTLEASEVKEQQISLEPKSYLNSTSVQGPLTQDRDLRNQGKALIS